jgi:DNA-binding response OmpR family regulator
MSKRVLLIEDEPNIIEAIRFLLSRAGYAVDTHSDGRTALDAVTEKGPDIVILDVMLPGRSGYEILQDLRASETTNALPVLMLTARGQRKDHEMASRYGASKFMTKPFANAALLEAVQDLASA